MQLDEWVTLIKNLGDSSFKAVAVEFLKEYFGCPVDYKDGTGDGGADAWVVLAHEPRLRRAAQFYAGSDWASKLADDVATFAARRDRLSKEARGSDYEKLFFVCTATPTARKFEEVASELLKEHGVAAQLLDARSIAATALDTRGALRGLLARELPGWPGDAPPSQLDEARLAFSFFHDAPGRYRSAVAKSGLATVLHREGAIERGHLLADTCKLLGLTPTPDYVEHALRNLTSEAYVVLDAETSKLQAADKLEAQTRASLALAFEQRKTLLSGCAADLAAVLEPGTHHRDKRAHEIAESIIDTLGLLVHKAIVPRALAPSDRGWAKDAEIDTRDKLKGLRKRLETYLGPAQIDTAMTSLVDRASNDPFARRLAAAELFRRITEHDASELARAFEQPKLSVLLDASIAMPLLCACYDQVAEAWPTSLAAAGLHRALTERGATLAVASVYIEEMASHALRARDFADVVGESGLERSENYFVAHYCSTRGPSRRSKEEFEAFLAAFGAVAGAPEALATRLRTERELKKVFATYGISVFDVAVSGDDPKLPAEPHRSEILLEHDRAVVRALSRSDARDTLVCTADTWLQDTLHDREITALDSAALADLLELVRPGMETKRLVSPRLVAELLTDSDVKAAGAVWDVVVELKGEVAPWKLAARGRAFRREWLASRKSSAVREGSRQALRDAWLHFRDDRHLESKT